MSDLRQRFYIEDFPVRGEVVHLEEALKTIFSSTRLHACSSNSIRRDVRALQHYLRVL